MLRFSANLNFLFNELPFMERFAAARNAGFRFVEFMFPYDFDLDEIENQLEQHELNLVLFNFPAGNWAMGDRGLAVDPSRQKEFFLGVETAVTAAQKLKVNRLNCLVGLDQGNSQREMVWDNLLNNMRYAANELNKFNLELMIEPLNHFDTPGFYLNTTKQVLKLISEVNCPNVYVQYDIYHAEREGEDHEFILDNCFNKIGHIQIADNPGRNEPGTGVIDYQFILNRLEQLKYKGCIGMEYKPSTNTLSSLDWMKRYGYVLS